MLDTICRLFFTRCVISFSPNYSWELAIGDASA
jgi:hypothetical protein